MDQEQERKDDGREHLTFVSYAREDAESVLEVTSSLREQGARLWVDQLDIPAGARWDLEIELALDRCDWFLVFLTNASCQSQNVMDEVSYAIDEGKHILPVRMEECRIPLRLRRFQYRDLTQAGGLDTLAQQLGIDTRRPTRNLSAEGRRSTIGSGPVARERTEPAHRIENIRTGKGKAVGSCGELIQGFDRNARPFHVTCPILKSSTVNVSIRDADSITFPNERRENYKLIAACRAALECLKAPQVKVSFEHWSDLHVGKGMGSSTADIVAAARATGNAFNYDFSESELAKIACSIESSDGTMYSGVNVVNHKTGDRIRKLEWFPDFRIVLCIPPNTFNTESANFSGKERMGKEFERLLDVLQEAEQARDPKKFGYVCLRSAELNQSFLPNPIFSRLESRIGDLGASGMCVGHTGTVVGVLFAGQDATRLASDAVFEIGELLPSKVSIELTRITAGSYE